VRDAAAAAAALPLSCRCDARARGPRVGADTRAARSFAAGEAPEQLQARGATQAEGGGLALSEDETHAFLEQLATLAKVRAAIARRLGPAARGRTAGAPHARTLRAKPPGNFAVRC
jgi:hypothetical protein